MKLRKGYRMKRAAGQAMPDGGAAFHIGDTGAWVLEK